MCRDQGERKREREREREAIAHFNFLTEETSWANGVGGVNGRQI